MIEWSVLKSTCLSFISKFYEHGCEGKEIKTTNIITKNEKEKINCWIKNEFWFLHCAVLPLLCKENFREKFSFMCYQFFKIFLITIMPFWTISDQNNYMYSY